MPHADIETRREYYRGWQKRNRDKVQSYQRQYRDQRKDSPEYQRRRKSIKLKSQYGITLEQYEKMHNEQGGRCAICGDPPEEGKLLVVDHNHETDKVRGLLCNHCNWMIGQARENISILAAGIEYLEQHREE